jgi:hypothetical protein
LLQLLFLLLLLLRLQVAAVMWNGLLSHDPGFGWVEVFLISKLLLFEELFK